MFVPACRFDQQIDNGAIQSNAPGENRFLDIASVNCDVGYAADPQEVQCQASGEWQHATCRIIMTGNYITLFFNLRLKTII